MSEIYSQMETFFRNFFNTGVPGLSHNVEFSENEVEQILRQEFSEAWDPIEQEWRLWNLSSQLVSQDGEPTRQDFRNREKELRNAIQPDYYTIVDGGWLASNANLVRAGIPNLTPQNFSYGETQQWFDSTIGRKSLTITEGRTRYWIFSDGAIFLLMGGNQGLLMTRDQMQTMIDIEMISGNLVSYFYGQPLLNWFAFPFNPMRFSRNPK